MRPLSLLVMSLFLIHLSVATAQAQGPELRLLEPMPNGVILGDSIQIIFEVSGFQIVPSTVPLELAGKRPEANHPGQGHLHFMLDLRPLVVWDKADPYTFIDVPPGDHLLMIELVNNDHSSLTPPQMLQTRVTVQATTQQPADTLHTLPETGPMEFLQTMRGRLLLLFSALMLIDLGYILRRWEESDLLFR